jgi:hypothetical protein
MIRRFNLIPKKWRLLLIFCLVVLHAVPLLFSAAFLLPQSQAVLKHSPIDPTVSFLQANSFLSVQAKPDKNTSTPLYTIRLDTLSQTNKSVSERHDITLLFQDGILVGSSHHEEKDVDTVIQRLEVKSKYNHLFQAVTLHHASIQNDKQLNDYAIQQTMSYDYLYVSATKYGGIQSFHQPETMQHRNWKNMIDHQIHHQLNLEWNLAIKEFNVKSDDYYIFPMSQLPLYSEKDELPGISSENTAQVLGLIWNEVYEKVILDPKKSGSANGSRIPLILISKDGSHLRIIFRTPDGSFHEVTKAVENNVY